MAFSNGTNLFSYFQSRMMGGINYSSYQNIQNFEVLRGNKNESFGGRVSGVNDIICGASCCGSYEDPTWQFCWRKSDVF